MPKSKTPTSRTPHSKNVGRPTKVSHLRIKIPKSPKTPNSLCTVCRKTRRAYRARKCLK